MQRELSSFPLPASQRMKLHQAGFVTVEDLEDVKPSELSKELELSAEEALELLQVVRGKSTPGGSTTQDAGTASRAGHGSGDVRSLPAGGGAGGSRSVTALDLLQEEHGLQSIVTFSQALDEILGGGVPLTKITEFCGAPGIGKTQMCMQLAVDAQIPEVFGGQEGSAIYIDTEGSLVIERLRSIADATVSHCAQCAAMESNPEQTEAMKTFTTDAILSNIHYFRCHDYVELLAVIHLLPAFLVNHPRVRVLVVDSIAFLFRHDFEDYALRTRILNGMAQSFIKMATLNKLAVVLTNQMTTRMSGGQGRLVPALGESWGHAATVRVVLYWQDRQRHALLYKSPSRQEATALYQVTVGGIRDVYPPASTQCVQSPSGGSTEEPRAKRPRTESS